MKHPLLAIAFIFVVLQLTAQHPKLAWQKGMAGTGSSNGNFVATDAAGNTYTVGSFTGTVIFDPGRPDSVKATSTGSNDVFLYKLDASGNFKWAVHWGGTGNDDGWAVTADPFGNVYVEGTY